jgi:hypothetical protein
MSLLRKVKIYKLLGYGLNEDELYFVAEIEKVFSNINPHIVPKYYNITYHNKIFFCTKGKPVLYKENDIFYIDLYFQYEIFKKFNFIKNKDYDSIILYYINNILNTKEVSQSILAINYIKDMMLRKRQIF